MRDFTKSMIRFSWAMSMLGLRQATNLISAPRGGSMETIDALSHSAEKQMGESFSGFFRAGDRLQHGLVDTVADLAANSWSDPAGALDKSMRQGWEALDRSWSGLRRDR